ncbi:methyltransferase domain-containing protein [Megalodesulfovibrio gigas]|uniref:Arsenite methyltransferase n=1 Tax=Megalodesulfovibrio gigas (strain ATCC 19364 / DSM 1382 / NCIMB 9332 / VKM B-1759) TaxID=1121448 RepID=T2GAF7_MEGG1|nr:methyltransferase domain-containing protein [Megalodesulfovibrio gigas]AGW13159.1 putative Methyltransferase type 11 [Megalodesulfovibrio gigas DSM 1382 = ATCC 19364]
MSLAPIHTQVSKAYAEALELATQGQRGGCCGGSVTVFAGYGQEASDYQGVQSLSFGCGNPLALAGVQPGQTVLDLGSGAGLDLLLASDLVGPEGRVIGVDMTEAMLAMARRNIEAAGKSNIEVRQGCIEALPVADANVDWVISNCVVNLSPDKAAVFQEIARVLAPGGQVSISDIVAESLPDCLHGDTAAYCACVGGAIPEAAYLQGLEAVGLVDVRVADRLVYDEPQLRGLLAREDVAGMVGKVASVRVVARKP